MRMCLCVRVQVRSGSPHCQGTGRGGPTQPTVPSRVASTRLVFTLTLKLTLILNLTLTLGRGGPTQPTVPSRMAIASLVLTLTLTLTLSYPYP